MHADTTFRRSAAADESAAHASNRDRPEQEKYNQGEDRADDTGVAGMPAGRKVDLNVRWCGNSTAEGAAACSFGNLAVPAAKTQQWQLQSCVISSCGGTVTSR